MISWIQKYFQHHFKVIFAVLLGVTIIAFVFTIGAAPGIGNADRQGVSERPFFSYNLALQSDQQRLMGDAGLSASLRLGAFAQLDGDQVQNYAFQRAATLHLADTWHIPAPTAAEITEQIKTCRMFAGQDGQFDAKAYQTFRDNLKTNPRGITEADILRVIGDDVRAEKVQALLSGPGYVLPADVRSQLGRTDTTWTLATATADYAAYKPEIKPSEAELTQFFEQAGSRYDIPPHVVVNYLDFSALEYLPKVTLTDAEIRAFYDANPARFPKPADPAKPVDATKPDVAKPADPAADFAAVRPQVESTLKFERAQRLANKAASDVSLAIFESKARTSEAIGAFLASRKLTPKSLAPFTRDAAPAELGGSPEAVAEAFRLGKDRPASDAISTPTGAVILFWKETQPTRKPLFNEVKDKVATDYIEGERRKRFIELGKTAKAALETRVKGGETLEKAAAAVADSVGLKLEVKAIAPFALRTRPQDLDFSVLGALERLEKGQVSDMVFSGEKGIFVHAVEKQAPDVAESNPRFKETRDQIAGFSGRIGASAFVSELVERELKKTTPEVR
ncbi:MAG: peptidyl-prolyl cis-trans isomerase [Verrucomicrobia bacterium]|nr:peptidyl-prolyl cis-trans isomerase [Verrucomicrobiota bacterium]